MDLAGLPRCFSFKVLEPSVHAGSDSSGTFATIACMGSPMDIEQYIASDPEVACRPVPEAIYDS